MLPLIQIASALFALGMAYITYVGYRRRQFQVQGLILWESIWFGLASVALFPRIIAPVTSSLHVARLLDVVIILGMLALGAITYRNYRAIEITRLKLDRLTARSAQLRNLANRPDPSTSGTNVERSDQTSGRRSKEIDPRDQPT